MGRQARMESERRLARQAWKREKLQRAAEGERRGCLVCRNSDGGFMTQEHPLPESLGNTEIVLSNGIVCDRCNGGILSDLDQALCEFFPIKMRRTMLGITSKTGKVPQTRFQSGSLRHGGLTTDGQAALYFEINSPSDTTTLHEKSRVGNRVELGMEVKGGKPMTPRYCSVLARALLKSAFECAWLDHGEMMLEKRFDHIRDAILDVPREGFLLVGRHGEPDRTDAQLVYDFAADDAGRDRIWVWATLYGLHIGTDSRLPTPLIEVPEDHAVLVRFGPRDLSAAA
jgi:hypothetical protein